MKLRGLRHWLAQFSERRGELIDQLLMGLDDLRRASVCRKNSCDLRFWLFLTFHQVLLGCSSNNKLRLLPVVHLRFQHGGFAVHIAILFRRPNLTLAIPSL